MKVKNIFVSASLVAGSLLSINTAAQAASFTTNFTPNNPNPTENIWLQSIEQNGYTVSDFHLVESATINSLQNNLGPSSTDRGDNASGDNTERPTGAQIAANLGNRNLNNIIDNEDNGIFDIDVFFDSLITQDNSGLDSLFFWERGKNSDLEIQALDASGNLIGNALTLLRNEQTDAGFRIDTTEIGGPQYVGSWGVNLAQLGVTELKGLKLTSNASFKGPDFKVVARKTAPEPGIMIGLGTVATLGFLGRRRLRNNGLNSAH